MVNPETDSISTLAGAFLTAKDEAEAAYQTYITADDAFHEAENELMNKMQQQGVDSIVIGTDTYKILGTFLVKIDATPVTPDYPSAP